MAQKLIRFEGATLHWDLWDTTVKNVDTGLKYPFKEFFTGDERGTVYSVRYLSNFKLM